ncbi:MAG TPA: zinc ribbon domain-containing protein [Clostridia bacterium]
MNDFYPGSTKKCGYCGEDVRAEAKRCPYCGSIIESDTDYTRGQNAPDYPDSRPTEQYRDNERANSPDYTRVPDNSEDRPNETNPSNDSYYTPSGVNETRNTYPPDRPASQPNYANRTQYGNHQMPQQYGRQRSGKLSNGIKVFLSTLAGVIPGVGQIVGIITAIVFMNSDYDEERKSFGVSLLVASIIMFVVWSFLCFVAYAAGSAVRNY